VVLVALVSVCALVGCSQHARVLCEPLELMYRGDPAAAVAAIDETELAESDRDRFLYHAQRGHLLHLAGDFEASNREFEVAAAVSDELEPWSVTETLTDYTFNEAVKAYSGEDYERAYLHYYMALNYLEMDDLQGALVECRRLDEVFRKLDARYEDDGRYQEDGFIRYLSGLIYESMGARDDARVDFRLAVRAYEGEWGGEIGVPLPQELEWSLDSSEHPRWPADRTVIPEPASETEHVTAAEPDTVPFPVRAGHPGPQTEIIVVIESGWAPYKVEKSVEVPIHRALVPEELRGPAGLHTRSRNRLRCPSIERLCRRNCGAGPIWPPS
jgi:tetratricopeptide (TPR) repeat protein